MSRVLIGEFGRIVQLGLEDLLEGEELYILSGSHEDDQISHEVATTDPDVVVVDLNHPGTNGGRDLARAFPSVTVIACSSVEPLMRVFPRFHLGEFYETSFSPTEFLEAVKSKG